MSEDLIVELILLCLFAFSAGLIDAAVGGGGLIQIPALFNILPNVTPATLFGINKFSSSLGTAFAAKSYLKRVRINWSLVLPAASAAFIFSFIGAASVSLIPSTWLRPIILVLLIVMAIYTLHKKDFGKLHKPVQIERKQLIQGVCIGALIGFYDGIFGPGTGSFLMFLFIRFFAFDFLHASASAKIVNLATNIAALVFFIPSGNIIWIYAVWMAGSNIAGSQVGSFLALRNGAGFVRILFLILTSVLICKLAWDSLSPFF